ncbi:hypothetical protein scyTo_0017274, partial [Scyliorhinus torazame]|nr:hypothetical protein [Scyliorhinus torazame]
FFYDFLWRDWDDEEGCENYTALIEERIRLSLAICKEYASKDDMAEGETDNDFIWQGKEQYESELSTLAAEEAGRSNGNQSVLFIDVY